MSTDVPGGEGGLGGRVEELERQLAVSEQRFETLLHGISDGVFAVDREARFLWVNDFIARNSGFPREVFVGRHCLDMIRPEDHELVMANFERALAGEPVAPFELAYRTAAGKLMWVELNCARYTVGDETLGVLAISRNIQRRKQAEQDLRESEEKYRTLIDAMPGMVVILQDDAFVFANRATREMFGTDLVVDPRAVTMFVAPSERERIGEMLRRRTSGERMPVHYQTQIRRADGADVPVEVFVCPIQYGGRPALQCIAFDLSERMQLEREIQQLQRMEALGTLAGGIAHDFNNLITGMLAAAELAKRRADNADGVRQSADIIIRAASRAAVLTEQLLGFARREAADVHPVDVVEGIAEVEAIVAPTLSDAVRVARRIDRDNSVALCDEAQLQQVILNLALNARDAMPSGGELTFSVDRVELPAGRLIDAFEIMPGTYLRISVGDSGAGIPADVIEHIYEPFFTTKERGRGTGMGLAVVYGIVRANHGAIDVETSPEGTTFSVFLPCAGQSDAARARAEPVEPVSGRGTILLVDDEQVVRESTAALLESLGYDVIACANGATAVDVLAGRSRQVAAALVDVRMPGMDGWSCASALRAIDSDLAISMISGNPFDAPPEFTASVAYLSKPFTIAKLSRAVAKLVDQRSDAAAKPDTRTP